MTSKESWVKFDRKDVNLATIEPLKRIARSILIRLFAGNEWLREAVGLWLEPSATGHLGTGGFRSESLAVDIPYNEHLFLLKKYETLCALKRHCDARLEVSKDVVSFFISGLSFELKNAEDIYILAEIFLAGCYDFELAAEDAETVIVDIGTNAGFASLYFAKIKKATVYGFEPFTPTFQRAEHHVRQNSLGTQIVLRNVGLSNANAEATVEYAPTLSGQMTVLGPQRIRESQFSTISQTICLRRASEELTPVFRNHSEKSDFVLKMDCEGAEFEIIKDLGQELRRFRLILMEWHDHRADEAVGLLKSQGFDCIALNRARNRDGMLYCFRNS